MSARPTQKPVRLGERSKLPKVRTLGAAWSPFDDLYHSILNCAWWQFFAYVTVGLLSVNALFAIPYFLADGAVANARPGSFEDAFFFSVQTMATIGYGGMAPATRLAHVVVTIESVVGTLATALITGATFAKFAKPTARVLFCEKVVVAPRHGVPHLMFRMANWRHNQIVEAQLRVSLLIDEVTPEGDTMRRPIEVPLVREKTAVFFLSFQAMHVIDEKSPFFGGEATIDRLKASGGSLFLTLTGMDETIGQNIHARYQYSLDDIVFGARFVDVISADEDGTRQIDYGKFHQIERIGGDEGAARVTK